MPNLTIYVREEDMPYYEKAKKIDSERPLSQILTQSLKEYLEKFDEEGFRSITIEIGKELILTNGKTYGTFRKIRFKGRLVAKKESSNKAKFLYDTVYEWFLYVTPNGGWVAIRERWYKNDDAFDFEINPLLCDREYWTAKSFDELKTLKDPDNQEESLVSLRLLEAAEDNDLFVEDLEI